MKMNIFLGALIVAVVGMMAVYTPAVAQKRQHGGGDGMGAGKMGKVMEKLNLTADQKAKIKALREQFKSNNATALNEVKGLRDQMKNARKQKDRTQMQGFRDQMKTKMDALRPAREQLQNQIAAILTTEQKAELEKMKAERKENRGGKRGSRNKDLE